MLSKYFPRTTWGICIIRLIEEPHPFPFLNFPWSLCQVSFFHLLQNCSGKSIFGWEQKKKTGYNLSLVTESYLTLGICLWHRWSSDSLSTKWVIFGKPFLSQNVSNCETEDIQEVICRLQFKFYPILILNKCSSSSPTLPKLHPWRFNWWLMIHSNHS